MGRHSIALPPTTILPTNIAALTGRSIFFHKDCTGYKTQQIDKNSTNRNQSI